MQVRFTFCDSRKKLHCYIDSCFFLPALCGLRVERWGSRQASGGCQAPGSGRGMAEEEVSLQVSGPDDLLWRMIRHWVCGLGLWAIFSGCWPNVWSPVNWGPSCLMAVEAATPQRWKCCPRCLLPSTSLERRSRERGISVTRGDGQQLHRQRALSIKTSGNQ